MDKSSVVHFLKIQENQLENQLKALRQTIGVIEGGDLATVYNSGSAAIAEAPSTAGGAAPVAPASDPVVSEKPKNKLVGKAELNGRKVRPVKMPKDYDSKLSYTRKLAYLLSKEGPKTSQELIKLVEQNEPGEDKNKIARSVTITASAMFRKGLVEAKRKGRAYVYSI